MATVRYTLDPDNPPRLSKEARARLDALTPEEIERNAESDPDNPPLTEEELERMRIGAPVQRARRALGLTQAEFAKRFHINLARLRDWEQGRFQPDSVALAYLSVIAHAPEVVMQALAPVALRPGKTAGKKPRAKADA